MTPEQSLEECVEGLNRAVEANDFSTAQVWLAEYRNRFDQNIHGLPPAEVLPILSAAIQWIKSARYATSAARSHIAAQLTEITRGAPYRKTEARHTWEFQG
jgi:hypothetical protein